MELLLFLGNQPKSVIQAGGATEVSPVTGEEDEMRLERARATATEMICLDTSRFNGRLFPHTEVKLWVDCVWTT